MFWLKKSQWVNNNFALINRVFFHILFFFLNQDCLDPKSIRLWVGSPAKSWFYNSGPCTMLIITSLFPRATLRDGAFCFLNAKKVLSLLKFTCVFNKINQILYMLINNNKYIYPNQRSSREAEIHMLFLRKKGLNIYFSLKLDS